jgi:hypothetical protein
MTAERFCKIALSLEGATEAAHFDRRAFRTRRIFATLAADGASANLCLTPDDQEHWCERLPDAVSPVPNRWGARGWTTVRLNRIDPADLETLLRIAWARATS